jgi:hypothetical protein
MVWWARGASILLRRSAVSKGTGIWRLVGEGWDLTVSICFDGLGGLFPPPRLERGALSRRPKRGSPFEHTRDFGLRLVAAAFRETIFELCSPAHSSSRQCGLIDGHGGAFSATPLARAGLPPPRRATEQVSNLQTFRRLIKPCRRACPVDSPSWRKATVSIRSARAPSPLPTGAGHPAGSLSRSIDARSVFPGPRDRAACAELGVSRRQRALPQSCRTGGPAP